MTSLDDQIATYLNAIEVEGKTIATQASYANSLAHFRSIGRRLALPECAADYRVEHVYSFLSELRTRGAVDAGSRRTCRRCLIARIAPRSPGSATTRCSYSF